MKLRELIEEVEKKVLKISKTESVPDNRGLIIVTKHNSNKPNTTVFFNFNPISFSNTKKQQEKNLGRELTLKEIADIYATMNRFEVEGERGYSIKKLGKVINEKKGLLSIKEIVFPKTGRKIVVYRKGDGFFAKVEKI